MFVSYKDITDKLGEPVWWVDGYPRYCPFDPHEVKVYIDIAVLLHIECQACSKPFNVATYWGSYANRYYSRALTELDRNIKALLPPIEEGKLDSGMIPVPVLRKAAKWPEIHPKRPTLYESHDFCTGDPPNHGCIGDTMGAYELEVLEYWEKGKDSHLLLKRVFTHKNPEGYEIIDHKAYKAKTGHNIWDWVRYPEFELNVDFRNARST